MGNIVILYKFVHIQYGADMMIQDKFVSPHALAKISGWPASRIKKLVSEKRIKFIKVGGKTLIPSNALDEFVEANLNLPDNDTHEHRQS